MLSYPFSIFYYEIEKRKTKGRYIHGPHTHSDYPSWECKADTVQIQDDVITWKHFPRYWPFVRGIHWSPVNSPPQRPVTRSFDFFCDLRLNNRLSKQLWGWLFETQSRSL